MEILAISLDTIGKLLIAVAALGVHHRFLNEHKIDNKVVSYMKFEQKLGLLGIVLMIAGYVLKIYTL